MPKVTSAVVVLRFRPPPVSIREPALFDQMVRIMFTQRRKTALNALRPFATRESLLAVEQVFEQARVDPGKRPGDLELSELADLSEVLRLTPR
jgi:16S rRNA A1518/A1519 N6-dimethyltransferase RsmA/KsgA/DIM1 with predicted DNA glycosylase/AP lyase activity